MLVLTVALTSSLLLAVPAQALPQKASLTGSPAVSIVGEQMSFSGVVPTERRARRVLLQRYIEGKWVGVASALTTSLGAFRVTSRAPASVGRFSYRVLAPRVAKQRLRTVRTPTRVVRVVRQRATLSAPATGVVQKAFAVTGRFFPARFGRRVQVQQRVAGAWKAVAHGRQNRNGVARVSVTVAASTAGARSFRAVALARAAARTVASPIRVVNLAGDPPGMPQLNAVDTTPRVIDDYVVTEAGVRGLRQVGSTMYAGGSFNRVQNAARTTSYTRTNLFSFDADSGAVTNWAPAVNAPVYAMEASADGRYLYIGGDFSVFDGVAVNRLVKYDLQLQAVDTSFVSPLSSASRISDLQVVGDQLFAAGTFEGGIVALDPTTGAQTPYFDPVEATGSETGFSTRVYRFAVNPDATRMVVIGSFTAVGGAPRQQVAMIHLGTATAAVSSWASTRWDEDCISTRQWYTRAVAWSPDGSYFAIATTGAGYPRTVKLCDTVTRWNPVDAADQQPVWINYSGGDTFHSLAITSSAVYAGGHFRWLDNPLGRDFKGPGAVSRPGLGAMNPATGKALLWNPTRSLEGGLGAFDLYVTSRGLWVAHFERYLGTGPSGRELHEGLGLLPFWRRAV